VDQGSGGWADASWPGITADLKSPSTVTWNSQTDLSQMMMTSKKTVSICRRLFLCCSSNTFVHGNQN